MILPFASFPSLRWAASAFGSSSLKRDGSAEWVQRGCQLTSYAPPELTDWRKKSSLDLTADPATLHWLHSVVMDFQVLSVKKKKLAEKEKKKSKARMKEILNSLTDKMEGKLKSSWEGLWWKILLNLLQNRAWSTITLWSCFLLMMEGRRLYLEHVITPVMFPKTQAGYVEKLNGTFCINVRKVMNSPFLTISLFWGVARSDPSSFLNVFASFFPWQLHAKRTFHLLTCRASVQNQRNHERPKRHTQGHTEAG